MVKTVKTYHATTQDADRAKVIWETITAIEEWENVLKNNMSLMKRWTEIDQDGIAVASNEQALGVAQVTIRLQQINAVTQ